MSKKSDLPITRKAFMRELRRYERCSISRRQFLGVTGLGMATAVMVVAMPGLLPRKSWAFGDLGDRLVFSTWPNYHNPVNLEEFTEITGVDIQVNAFGSNEEMLAKLQAGGTGWDVFVPTNYTISNYVELNLIQELDLSRIPNYDGASNNAIFAGHGNRRSGRGRDSVLRHLCQRYRIVGKPWKLLHAPLYGARG